jgi:hypothetical protein
MQTLQTAPPSPVAFAPRPLEVPLVIFTALDVSGTSTARWLASRNVPIVFVSSRPAPEVLAMQASLGVRHPFVCDDGAALYIPAAYFPELTRIGTFNNGWNIVEFKPPYDTGHGVRLLTSLFRVSSDHVVIVGLAERWQDRVLLHESDVPVIVRSGHPDQLRLLECVPSAYLTDATGTAGWCEAVQGTLPE